MGSIIELTTDTLNLLGDTGNAGSSENLSSICAAPDQNNGFPTDISHNENKREQCDENIAIQPADSYPAIPERFMMLEINGEKVEQSGKWTYRDEHGKVLCHVQRFDFGSEDKEFRPLTPTFTDNGTEWQRKALAAPRPLYGLDRLAAQPNADVIVCEGEKSADSASRLFPHMVAVTSMNGAKSPEKSDWSTLRGRTVYLWGDFDQAGKDYISKVEKLATIAGANALFMVDPTWFLQMSSELGIERLELSTGWDAADAELEGFTAEIIQSLLDRKNTQDNNSLFKLIQQSQKVEVETNMANSTVPSLGVTSEEANNFMPGLLNDTRFTIYENCKGFKNGVYWLEPFDKEQDEDPIPPLFICSPLIILAETRDAHQSNWGRLIFWLDNDGHEHFWACPSEFLAAADTAEFRRELVRNGLNISTYAKARQKLVDYVVSYPPQSLDRIRCVTKTGWQGTLYVQSNRVFGKQVGESVIFQGAVNNDFSSAGNLDEWKREVSSRAVGNSRIIFAISTAFAGPLVEMANESGGGFQFTGATSRGKTSTLIDPAASVYGHPDRFAKKWRTTANGLEAICLSRNHSTLILDDLGQSDAKECGQAAYLIANGQGKVRMQKDGVNRPITTWKTLILSSGEIDLAQHMAEAGKVAKGGQVARLPSIPADAGEGMFVLEQLHDQIDGRQFSDVLKAVTREYYGTAGVSFLEQLTEPETLKEITDSIREGITEIVKTMRIPTGVAPEVGRVAARFALVAFAGELAIRFGVCDWAKGDALRATNKCFDDWMLEAGGTAGADDKALFLQVSSFLQAHGSSRFPPHDILAEDLRYVQNRAGFSHINGEDVFYLAESGTFKRDLCKGFNYNASVQSLIKAGWLLPGPDRTQHKRRIRAIGGKGLWFYLLTGKALGGEL